MQQLNVGGHASAKLRVIAGSAGMPGPVIVEVVAVHLVGAKPDSDLDGGVLLLPRRPLGWLRGLERAPNCHFASFSAANAGRELRLLREALAAFDELGAAQGRYSFGKLRYSRSGFDAADEHKFADRRRSFWLAGAR